MKRKVAVCITGTITRTYHVEVEDDGSKEEEELDVEAEEKARELAYGDMDIEYCEVIS